MKKRYLIIWVITQILGMLLIPLNLFIWEFPEWYNLLGVGVMTASMLLFLFKVGGKWFSKVIVFVCTIVFCAFTWFGAYCNPYWNSILMKDYLTTKNYDTELSYDQAAADIKYVMHFLKKDHPLCKQGMPDDIKEAFEKVLSDLKNEDVITVNLLEQKIQNVLSLLEDAHTCCYSIYGNYHYLRTIQAKKDEGYALTQINHIPLKDLLHRNMDLFSYEVESWAAENMFQRLSSLEGLAFLGLNVEDGITYTWENESGETIEEVYDTADFITYEEYNELYPDREEPDPQFVSFRVDEEHDLAILTLYKCHFNDTYKQCLQQMFQQVKDMGIQNVCVDLRDNGGGSSAVAEEFIRYLDVDTYFTGTELWRFGIFDYDYVSDKGSFMHNDKYDGLTFTGNVYILTSAGTFSSAMLFADYIKDNHIGTLIGEAPGNAVSGYGEVAEFILPQSKLVWQVSTKTFTRADRQTKDVLVMPDIPCDADVAMDILYEQLK